VTFNRGKFGDQADSTSQALDWAKERTTESGYMVWLRQQASAQWV
jgi:hypothetical protein